MMQYQQHSPMRGPVRASSLHRIKQVCFPVFIGITLLLAFPAFLIGFVIWWGSLVSWDRHEYWRTTIAVAVFGLIGYVTWLFFADPWPWFVASLGFDLVNHLWGPGEQTIGLLWLFHLWLAPAIAPVLAVLYPGRRGKLPFEKLPVPKSVMPHETEQGERDLETTALMVFERMMATLPGTNDEQVNLARAAGISTIAIPGAAEPKSEALGTYEGGELEAHVRQGELCLPPELLEVHGVVVGEPKFGKTFTLLRLATIARSYGRKVVFLDLKGSRKTATLFLAAMSLMGVQRVKLYPLDAYDGWRGDPQALYNRLMEQIDPASHPFYRSGVGSTGVSLAVKAPDGPPRNSYEFLERLDVEWLRSAYAQDAQALREIKAVEEHVGGVQLVMAGFFRGIAGGLDGSWAIDDVDACYIGINGVDHKEEAAAFGRYILEDAANYATSRKDPKVQVLFIIDEFGVLRSTNATALYESVREAGMAVYAAGQSYHSLGRERDHLLAAAAVKILHRTGNPRPIVEYAGEREHFAFSRMVGTAGDEEELLRPTANRPGDDGNQHTILRPQKELAVLIEDVQRLEVGHIAFISGGRGGYVQVYPLELPPLVVQAAARYIASIPKFEPLPPPKPAPAASIGPINQMPPRRAPQKGFLTGGPSVTKRRRPGRLAPKQRGLTIQSPHAQPPHMGQAPLSQQQTSQESTQVSDGATQSQQQADMQPEDQISQDGDVDFFH